jgi:hypothetical protein
VECPKVIWYLLQNSISFFDLKDASLLVMIFLGHPKQERILVSNNLIITNSIDCLQGTTSIHFVNYSIVVSIHLCWPEEGG